MHFQSKYPEILISILKLFRPKRALGQLMQQEQLSFCKACQRESSYIFKCFHHKHLAEYFQVIIHCFHEIQPDKVVCVRG